MRKFSPVLPLALSLGCGDGAVPDAEACEHFPEGPFAEVVATADPDDAPTVDQVHVAYRIDLSSDGPVYVTFDADEAGELFFYASQPVSLELRVDDGPVTPEESCFTGACSEACDLIEARAVLDHGGGPVTVGLGPGDGEVMLLVEEGASHGH